MVERQFNAKVKIVRSDNGTEFKRMQDYFRENGIVFQTSRVNTPQQNGRVERKHRHILNVARALRFQANLPLHFWGDCVLAASYIISRTPFSILHNKTPYELLFNAPPSFDEFRVFGCLCYAYNVHCKRDKLMSRSRKYIFIGYPQGKKGWKLYDLDTGDYFVSRDVKFYEHIFPFAHPDYSNSTNEKHDSTLPVRFVSESQLDDPFYYVHEGNDFRALSNGILSQSVPTNTHLNESSLNENSSLDNTEMHVPLNVTQHNALANTEQPVHATTSSDVLVPNNSLREDAVATPTKVRSGHF